MYLGFIIFEPKTAASPESIACDVANIYLLFQLHLRKGLFVNTKNLPISPTLISRSLRSFYKRQTELYLRFYSLKLNFRACWPFAYPF